MSKKIFFLTVFSLLILSINPFVISAQDSEYPPEKNGVYDVPGHKNIKVKVFVHEPQKPSSSPVLACTDIDSTTVVDPAGWKLPQGNWTYFLNPSSVPSSVGPSNLSSIASNSFSQWQNAISGKVSFVTGTDTTIDRKGLDSKNIIAWGRTSGSALAVTYTWYNTSTGLAVETDTIFNKKFPWGWSNTCNANYYDAQDILTHELGHWMGLNDEYASAYVDNTMYGYGSKGEVKKDTLTSGDKTGVQNLYP